MFKKGDKVIAVAPIDGIISKDATGICNKDQYDPVYVEVKWDDFVQGWGAGKAYWNVENKDIKLYQESTKTLNKDTVKVGQKVRVIADSAISLGFITNHNNGNYKKGYEGIITTIKPEKPHVDHRWVLLNNTTPGVGIGTMLLELLEEPKSESLQAKDLVKGEWYKVISTLDNSYIFKFDRISHGYIYQTLCWNLQRCCKMSSGNLMSKEYIKTLQKADEFLVSQYFPDEFKSKDVIPEYVECIKGYNTDLSVKDFNVVGKIYEVESYNPKTEELKLKGFIGSIAAIKFDGNSKGLCTDYKISTKAEFDLQNQSKKDLVGRYLKTLVNNPVGIKMNIGEYLLVTSFNTDTAVYDVTRVRDNHPGFGIEVPDLSKFEVMPIGFNLESQNTNTMENPLITEAKRRYPIGTKYYVAHLNKTSKEYEDTVDSHDFILNSSGVWLKGSTKEGWTRLLYEDSTQKWATIAEQPKQSSKEFKEYDVPHKKTSDSWSDKKYPTSKECYTELPIVTSVKRSNIVPLKLEKQKSLINLPIKN